LRIDNAVKAGSQLILAGLFPFIPHLFGLIPDGEPVGYEGMMIYDLAWLERCDALLRIPGYSPGADREVARARELGLPIFFTTSEVLQWAGHADRASRR
jgi:hypothetical protein